MSKYCCKNKMNLSYIKWLLELLGPVLLGSKPCEIITIPSFDTNKENKLKDIYEHFNNCRKIDIKIINKKNKGYKVLFINKESLTNQLENRKVKNFLKFLNYPVELGTEASLSYLIDKLDGDFFPDEIGIFLGYPLKDVIGFMGYGNYKFHSTRYWKVFGDPKPSEDLYLKFLEHRKKIRTMLNFQSVKVILSLF